MLVEHDVEPKLIRQEPFVVVAVKQIGGDARVAFPVRQVDPQRAAVIAPRIGIGLLGELIDLHAIVPITSVPVPTFVSLCSTLANERRNQRDTSNSMTLVWL